MTAEQEPTIKRMCYEVRGYLANTVGVLELLQEGGASSAEKQKYMDIVTKQARSGLEMAEKLFRAICVVDPHPIEL